MPAGFQPLELERESSSLLPKSAAPRSCEPEGLQHDKVGPDEGSERAPRPQGLLGGRRCTAATAAGAQCWPCPRLDAFCTRHAAVQDIAGFQGYRGSLPRQLLFALLCVVTCGALFVASRWFLRLRIALTLAPCPLAQADWVVVTVRCCRDSKGGVVRSYLHEALHDCTAVGAAGSEAGVALLWHPTAGCRLGTHPFMLAAM